MEKKDLKIYYAAIKKNLSCSYNMKAIFMKDLSNRVSDFLEEKPNSTIDTIIENFGTPEEIAIGFNNDNDYYKKKAKNRLIIEFVLLVLLVTTIVISICYISKILTDLGGNTIITTE